MAFSLSFEPKKVRSKKRLGPEKEMPGDEGRASEEFRTYLLIDLEQRKHGARTKAEQFGKGYEFRFCAQSLLPNSAQSSSSSGFPPKLRLNSAFGLQYYILEGRRRHGKLDMISTVNAFGFPSSSCMPLFSRFVYYFLKDGIKYT